MAINKLLADRLVSKINFKYKNFIVLILTNPHHVDLFNKIINKLIKNNNKNILFILDDRIPKNLLKKINKKAEIIFHHPTIEKHNFYLALKQIKDIISKKPDVLISMSSSQSYERILFDNANCEKLLIGPHHGDLYHDQFNPKDLKKTRLKNRFIKLLNHIFKFMFHNQIKIFILKIIIYFFYVFSSNYREIKQVTFSGIFLNSDEFLNLFFKHYESSPFFDKEFWFLFFVTRVNNLTLNETFCFDYSCQVGSKPTEFVCYSENEKKHYNEWFLKLNWKVVTHHIIDINDFIPLIKSEDYQIILCAPQAMCNALGKDKLISCLKLLSDKYIIKSMFHRPHPFATKENLNFYEKLFESFSYKLNIPLKKKLDLISKKVYITGPSSITSEIFNQGPIIVIKEFPIQFDRQTDYIHGTYAMDYNDFRMVQ